jgi:L-iditol 2-dehydrogenase
MKALVKQQFGQGFVDLVDIDEPIVAENEVLIKVKAAGICGSDIHYKEGTLTNYIPPVALGHEFAGEIVGLGNKVTGFKLGDRVVAEAHRGGCGSCRNCLRAEVEVCRQKRAIGYKIHGCFAPYVAIPTSCLHRIPDHLSYEHAALTEPIAIVMKAIGQECPIQAEDFVVVLGCGPIGLLAAAVAKAEGARAVMITGTDRDEKVRLEAARKMGIQHVVNIQKEDVVKKVMDLTNGVGADVVVEASGADPAIQQTVDLVRIYGSICGVGLPAKESLDFPWRKALFKGAHIHMSISSNWTAWERAVSILANRKIAIEHILSGTYPLHEWETAFHKLENLEAIKILLIP